MRSDEPRHAWQARAPYGRVHLLHMDMLDAAACAGLAAVGYGQIQPNEFSDIGHARVTPAGLAAAAPGVADLVGDIAVALLHTGVLGDAITPYRRSLARRIDFLACCGAGFHNDVGRHWARCLFWLLAIDLSEVEFVMPHAGVRIGLAPGDLLVFDQTLAHGLCRPADGGQAVAASFAAGAHRRQLFLTGELPLSDARWAALGAPWLPLAMHQARAALDLRVASFDERSGAIQGLRSLRDCMQRGSPQADARVG